MEKIGIECKQLMAKEVQERLDASNNLFITSFNRIVVPEQEQLRRKLKAAGVSLLVVKNRIVKQVLEQSNAKSIGSLMQGLTAITAGEGDAICISKTLVDFAAKNENFKILGAYVDEQLLDFNSVKELASIPPKEVLLAQIVTGIKSPIQGLVTSLSAVIKKFVVVLDKIREQK